MTSALLGVSGTYWGVHCSGRLVEKLNRSPLGIPIAKMARHEFQNALRKYAVAGLQLYTELAIDTYDPEEFKSVRAALRSPKFLHKVDQKLGLRMVRLKGQLRLPELVAVAKSTSESRFGSRKKNAGSSR